MEGGERARGRDFVDGAVAGGGVVAALGHTIEIAVGAERNCALGIGAIRTAVIVVVIWTEAVDKGDGSGWSYLNEGAKTVAGVCGCSMEIPVEALDERAERIVAVAIGCQAGDGREGLSVGG